MSGKKEKNQNNSLFDEKTPVDTSVSEAISEAFDTYELTTVGRLCLDARVGKSLTQEQASAMLKVRVNIIKDFENGNQIDLPGLTYKIGFVRSYARLLGLDGDLLVKEFKKSLNIEDVKEEYKFLTPSIEQNNILPLGAVLSFLIAIVIYTSWYYSDRDNEIKSASNVIIKDNNNKSSEFSKSTYVIIEENDDKANMTLPTKELDIDIKTNDSFQQHSNKDTIEISVVEKNKITTKNNDVKDNIKKNIHQPDIDKNIKQTNEMSAEANERDPRTEMVLKAIGNSWVEIEDIDGNILMTRLMRPGETYVVPNISGLTFNTGNAGALSLSQGDTVLPTLGKIGEIITSRPLNFKAFNKKATPNQ